MDTLLRVLHGTSLDKSIVPQLAGTFELYTGKSNTLLHFGQVASRLYFIEEGFVCLDVKANDRSIVRHIGRAGEFITPMDSFLNTRYSDESLRLLRNSKVYFMEKASLLKLLKQYPAFEKAFHEYISQSLIRCQNRISDLLSLDAEKYYSKLLSEYQDLVLMIPQNDLASFLGIAPQSLSRIRRNLLTLS